MTRFTLWLGGNSVGGSAIAHTPGRHQPSPIPITATLNEEVDPKNASQLLTR
ncbi:hypothetical protein [Rhodococcus qingshengii]|uniref:hypothetical protein n=1 Tax=Rhodococcus qingshengii TaxID=334542 RepID=UPI001C222994|nr:hypothetical protein [Rhodococcus qingshengii]QXC46491.1 hypothetical protein KSE96_30020 [Rhodococcus qingshengii]